VPVRQIEKMFTQLKAAPMELESWFIG